MGKRIKIGFLVSEYYDSFTRETCQGAMRAAEETDADLFFLTGGYLKSAYNDTNKNNYDYQNNYMFEFAKDTNLDALVISLGTICGNVSAKERQNFLEKFGDVPIITLASEVAGYNSILFDNKGGFANGVEHLIVKQGRKNIGIVSGPSTNSDANERLDAYKEVLEKHNLPVIEERIMFGDFSEYSDGIVEELLDKNPDLDAIVFANDHMARGAYRVMKKRNIRVGDDIAIVGFDDSDFASIMSPGLTTTRADSQELGYQAVMRACELAVVPKEERKEMHFRVETNLIVRDSCGGSSAKKSEPDEIMDPTHISAEEIAEILYKKTFDCSHYCGNKERIKVTIKEMVEWLNENLCKKPLDIELDRKIRYYFRSCYDSMMEYIEEASYYYDLTDELLKLYYPFVLNVENGILLREVKAKIFRNIHISVERRRDAYSRDNNILNWIMMDITRDIINNSNDEKKYSLLLQKMNMLHYASSFILLFPENKQCEIGDCWERPTKVYEKAGQKDLNCFVPENENQEIATADIFTHSYDGEDRRKTYAATILFSNREQYGILVMEPNKDNLVFIEPIRFQISSALQMLSLIGDKEKLNKQLEDNLEELRESNAFLDQVSKADELTQIYNRRGFLVTAKKMIKTEDNFGKRAVFIYADMNNLKLVNDQFGHEEGDYSLRAVADILKHSLGRSAIVGRMGGDEFAALLIFDENTKNSELLSTQEGIFRVIELETELLNASNDKPYYVSLSAGLKFFDIEIGSDMEDLIASADDNLYIQKAHKRKSILK